MHQSNNQARLHVGGLKDRLFPATDKMLPTIITFFLLVLVAEAFVVQPPAASSSTKLHTLTFF